jgi:hypothetical protein
MTTTTSTAASATQREPLGGHARPEDFRHRAACCWVDPEVFFPAATAGEEFEAQVSIAKAVCAGCPVRQACLSWALSALPDGIAGGMTEHERRTERARAARVARSEVGRSASGGGPGCSRALHQFSHANPLAGTRAEGHRG